MPFAFLLNAIQALVLDYDIRKFVDLNTHARGTMTARKEGSRNEGDQMS
jgi:hypothetical protein